MPIPRAKLLETQKPLDERILQFLDSRPDSAFTIYEILTGIGDYDPTAIALTMLSAEMRQQQNLLEPYLAALGKLQTTGKIMAAEWQGTTHYAVETPRKRI